MPNKRRAKSSKSNRPNPNLELHPSFKGQAVLSTVVDADPTIYTTTITTGVISGVQALSAGNITNFTTRFAMWQEYRIVKVHVDWTCISNSCTGVCVGWIDEAGSTAPTGNASLAAGGRVEFPLSDVYGVHSKSWSPTDVGDLEYIAVGSTSTIGWLKTYTSSSLYGAPTAATVAVLLRPKYTIQFRGLAA